MLRRKSSSDSSLPVAEAIPGRPWPLTPTVIADTSEEISRACEGRRPACDGLTAAVEAISRAAGFEVGHVYLSSTKARRLIPSSIWYLQPPASRFTRFVRTTASTVLFPGIGLPGQVVTDNAPRCLDEIKPEAHLPRARAALEDGLHSAYAYPLPVNPELTVVLEFLATGPIHRCDELDELLRASAEVVLPHLRDVGYEDLRPACA